MKASRRIKRSRLLINTGIQLIIVCLIIILVGAFLNLYWLIETSAIVAILAAIFILIEYWNTKGSRRRRR